MSRIGKMPIEMPAGVTAQLDGRNLTVKGPKGEQALVLPPLSTISIDGQTITVERSSEENI